MRYRELDSIRGLASLSVFFSHFVGSLSIDEYRHPILFRLIQNSPLHIFWDGHAAVILFFVLSGFVLAFPYTTNISNRINISSFLIKRIFRIYPAYFISLALCLFLKEFLFLKGPMISFSPWINTFWNWDINNIRYQELLKHLFMIGPSLDYNLINPVIWSLIVEMKISLIFPFIIYILQKRNHDSTYVILIISSILLCNIFNIGFLHYLPFFIFGSFLTKYNRTLYEHICKSRVLKYLLLVSSIVLYTSVFSLSFLNLNDKVADYLVSFGVVLIIIYSINSSRLKKILSKSILLPLGELSYSFYLLHLGILITFSSIMIGLMNYNTFSVLLILFISMAVSLIVSLIMYNLIEKPFMRYGKYLSVRIIPIQIYVRKIVSNP